MSFSVEITGADVCRESLQTIKNLSGDPRKTMKYVPTVISRIWVNIFQEKGSRFGGWEQPHVWTKLLRVKPGKKFSSLEEVANTQMNALIDTGVLKASFQVNHGDSSYAFTKDGVYGGSRLTKARRLNDGGKTEPFSFDAQKQYRLEKNFRKTKAGKKTSKRAKKNWNEEFFITRASMKKAGKEGRTFNMPARQMEPTQRGHIRTDELHNIVKAIDAGIAEMLEPFK